MKITNPISIAICVMQVGAGLYECWQGRPYLGSMWFGVAFASLSVGVMPL